MKRIRMLPSALVLALAAACLLLADGPALGDTYEWVDRNGNVGYADSLESVPAPYRKSAKRIQDKKDKGKPQTAPSISGSDGGMSPLPSLEEAYAPWLNRIRTARAELDTLKVQREKAQAAYDDLLRQRNLRSNMVDPETEAKATAAISEIDQKIRDKEYEINTTIPDQARQSGVPSSVLSQ